MLNRGIQVGEAIAKTSAELDEGTRHHRLRIMVYIVFDPAPCAFTSVGSLVSLALRALVARDFFLTRGPCAEHVVFYFFGRHVFLEIVRGAHTGRKIVSAQNGRLHVKQEGKWKLVAEVRGCSMTFKQQFEDILTQEWRRLTSS